MKRKRRGAPKLQGLLIVVAIILGIGLGVWIMPMDRGAGSLPPVHRARNGADVSTMSAGELRSEVKRLRAEIDEKDREIADLKIRLTLTTEGSHTK